MSIIKTLDSELQLQDAIFEAAQGDDATRVADLPAGRDLYKQRFASFGFYNKDAAEIMKEKFSDRFAVMVGGISQGNQGVTDRNDITYIDMGPYGHGFSTKAGATKCISEIKKATNKKNKEGSRETFYYSLTPFKISEIDKAFTSMKEKSPEYTKYISRLDGFGLAYGNK